MPAKLVSLTLNSAYLSQQVEFYKGLGFKIEKVAISKGGEVYRANYDGFEINLFGLQEKKAQAAPRLQLCFMVSELDFVFKQLSQILGVTILLEPTDMPEGRKAILKDPDGNSVEIIDDKSK